MLKYSFLSALEGRKDLRKYGNCLTLFALQLFFNIEDIEAVAADDIIDGPDDGAIDLVHIDTEQKFAVIAQEYVAIGKKRVKKTAAAPSKKARDLSSALTLLINVPIEKVPAILKSSAEKLRKALTNNEIETINIWYVHNLPGSKNVQNELRTAELTGRALVGSNVGIVSLEVCAEVIEKRYKSIFTPILVKETFEIPIAWGGMLVKEADWKAFVIPVPLQWLHTQYKKYGTDLFSANVRDYLGISKKIDKNINNSIQETAENDPRHFWIFNNGMTALVHKFKITKNHTLIINGISILNGAQTSGAVGNLSRIPDKSALVQVRFVQCFLEKTVVKIKKYNNSQNRIEAPDFRSRDPIQDRLQSEFMLTDISYSPRRGGVEDVIKRKPNTLSSVLAGQVLAAFHGRPDIAYHEKTKIWENDNLYIRYFNENVNAKHIAFSYSLFEAVKNKKLSLSKRNKDNDLKTIEQDQLAFFQTRGSVFLLASAIASCMEIFIDKKIANKFRLGFRGKKTFIEEVEKWKPLVEIASQFSPNLREGFSEGAIREKQAIEAIKKFSRLIAATKESNKEIFSNFAKEVTF